MKGKRLAPLAITVAMGAGVLAIAIPALANGRIDDSSHEVSAVVQGNEITVNGESDDGRAAVISPLDGSIAKIEIGTTYARAVMQILGLDQPEILRRSAVDVAGKPIVWDEVNRYTYDTGYQASIYFSIPTRFVEDHEGFPRVDTKVGPAWYSISGNDSISVALVNETTEKVVRVVYLASSGPLPEVSQVVEKAVELSGSVAVAEEGMNK